MSLVSTYDALLLDLDGTVWHGGQAVPGAVAAINSCGLPCMFVTNNASRAPEAVAESLRALNIQAEGRDILTSAQVSVALAQKELPPGAKVLVVGTDAYRDLARAAGFTMVASADAQPAAVLQGLSKEIGWRELTEAALAIRQGARFYASNLDKQLPMERGLAVGNGALVAAVTAATGVVPVSAGKPEPQIFLAAAQRVGATRPLVVGDRLDTDILGAKNAGMAAMHVLTGVNGAMDLIEAPVEQRPDFIGDDLGDLVLSAQEAAPGPQGGFTARVDGADILLDNGTAEATSTQALRTVLEVAWAMPHPPRYVRPRSAAAERATAGW